MLSTIGNLLNIDHHNISPFPFMIDYRCVSGHYRNTVDPTRSCEPCDCNGHGEICNEVKVFCLVMSLNNHKKGATSQNFLLNTHIYFRSLGKAVCVKTTQYQTQIIAVDGPIRTTKKENVQ